MASLIFILKASNMRTVKCNVDRVTSGGIYLFIYFYKYERIFGHFTCYIDISFAMKAKLMKAFFLL